MRIFYLCLIFFFTQVNAGGGLYLNGDGKLFVGNSEIKNLKQLALQGYTLVEDRDPSLWPMDESEITKQTYYLDIKYSGDYLFNMQVYEGKYTYLSIRNKKVLVRINNKEIFVGDTFRKVVSVAGKYKIYAGEMNDYIVFEKYPKLSFGTMCGFSEHPEMRLDENKNLSMIELESVCLIEEVVSRGYYDLEVAK